MSKKIKKLSEEEIDRLVIANANDDSAWEKSIRVRKSKSSVVSPNNKQHKDSAKNFSRSTESQRMK